MRLFGRRKPLHERLLEEGGLDSAGRRDTGAAHPTNARRPAEPGIHGPGREREWDALATTEAPQLSGHEVAFDVLPDRTVLVDDAEGDEPLTPLAEAIERDLQPPYRARAVRQSGDLWAVAARAIEAVRLPDQAGDALELTVRGDERELTVDGAREFGGIPELESLAGARHRDYVVRGERLDDDWWEVRIDPL